MVAAHRTSTRKGNWSVERRYQFIEFRLYWSGHINRSDIIEVFGISKQQASNDLASYIEGRKSNLTYDKRLRTYVRGKNFRPRFMQPDASEFFSQLQAVGQYLEPVQLNADAADVRVTCEFDETGTIPARQFITNTGWKILLDHGLDIFQRFELSDAFNLANRIQEHRAFKAFDMTYVRVG